MVQEEAIRWSAWPAVICYFVATGLRLQNCNASHDRFRRIFWLAGWFALLIHVVLAFALFHGGSWQAAYDHTARATLAATGWNSGAGLWVNLVTLLVWGADLLQRQLSARPPGLFRSRWDVFCQLYLASHPAFVRFFLFCSFQERKIPDVLHLLCQWAAGCVGSG